MTRVRGLLWQAVAVAVTAVFVTAVKVAEPMFWFVDDKRNQYIPAFMDIGRRLRDGEFPTIDPDLGTGGNYALDLQYGLYEPTHWLVAVGLSYFDNLATAGFVWSLAYLAIFAWGTTCLAQRLNATGSWAATAGVAAATSGYVLYWLAPNWMPGLMSIAWLPWLWWAWAGRLTPRRCVGIAVFSFLVIAGGWPATWLMFIALTFGLLCESIWLRDLAVGWRGWFASIGLRALSSAAGLVAAVVTVVPLLHSSDYTIRGASVENDNFLVANLADVMAFAAPNLHGDLQSFGSTVSVSIPIYFAAWFGLPLLWFVPWRKSLARNPGVISGAIGTVVSLLFTQAPSSLGPLRDPIRALAGAQFFFVVTIVVLACATKLEVSRRRLTGVVASLLAMAWLTWSRDPAGPIGALSMLGVGAAVALLAWVIRSHGKTTAGVVALAGSVGLAGLAFGLNDFREADQSAPATLTTGEITITPDDWPVYAVYMQRPYKVQQTWFTDGVGRAFQRLDADTRIAPGYSSIRQKQFSHRFCIQVAQGQSCKWAVNKLFATEPTTGKSWIDLLGYRTMLISFPRGKAQFMRHAGLGWQPVDEGKVFTKYQRSESASEVTGRITDVLGSADVQATSVSRHSQSYDVSAPDGARLVFRDLYWPGYQATLDGHRVKVTPLHDTLVTVKLPPGSEGELTLTYRPVSTAALVGLPAAGVGLLALAMVGALVYRRREDRGETDLRLSARVDGDSDEDEPDHRQRLEDPV